MHRMLPTVRPKSAALVALGLLLTRSLLAAPSTYAIDATSSTIEVVTGRAGLFRSAGHSHHVLARKISGEIKGDPDELGQSSLELTIEAPSLEVVDRGVTTSEVAEIQKTMESRRVLDIGKFPGIHFNTSSVRGTRDRSGKYRLQLAGMLELHGVTKALEVPADIELTGDVLRASGRVKIAQRDFGIKPYSAAMGLIKVANEVEIRFEIVARKKGSAPGQ